MLFKNSVRTSKRTPHFTIANINWLILFKFNPLNFDKTHYIPFTTKNSHQTDLDISYANKSICKALDTKFLGIHQPGYNPCGGMAAVVRCRGNVYYQMD
jgi:hypothetical protein